MKTVNKKENGITLVALVVTIIVLLILAGITINLLVGENGLFSRAAKAKLKYEIESAKEEVVLAIANEELRSQGENFDWQKVWEELRNNDENFKKPTNEEPDFNITYKRHDFEINSNKKVEHSESCKYCEGEYIEEDARYTITYKANGGIGEDIVQYTDESRQIKEVGFTKDMYEFVGWNTEEDGLGTDYEVGQNYTGKENITLYAKWQGKVTGKISVNQNVLTKGTKITLEVAAPTSQITKIEVKLGSYIVYSETMEKNLKKYSKEIELTDENSLNNIESLKFNNNYIPSLKITSLKNLEETVETTAVTSYLITDENDLKNLATQVNGGNKYEGQKILQVKDVDLSSVCGSGKGNWTPIGNDTNRFKGTYEGNYNTINKLYINIDNANYQGLFGVTDGAHIQNVVLDNVDITNKNGTFTAGIVGKNCNTEIYRCGVNGKIEGMDWVARNNRIDRTKRKRE